MNKFNVYFGSMIEFYSYATMKTQTKHIMHVQETKEKNKNVIVVKTLMVKVYCYCSINIKTTITAVLNK